MGNCTSKKYDTRVVKVLPNLQTNLQTEDVSEIECLDKFDNENLYGRRRGQVLTSSYISDNIVGLKVLVVDDSIAWGKLLINAFNHRGLHATISFDALSALKMLQGKLILIYICNFHVLSHLLLNCICKLHWNRLSTRV